MEIMRQKRIKQKEATTTTTNKKKKYLYRWEMFWLNLQYLKIYRRKCQNNRNLYFIQISISYYLYIKYDGKMSNIIQFMTTFFLCFHLRNTLRNERKKKYERKMENVENI